ncbi:MAG: hypothetical protein HY063_09560, partial [Bacteroidetes bacterium]|nr:hypothetical protein [Bacteroidota bacterium]
CRAHSKVHDANGEVDCKRNCAAESENAKVTNENQNAEVRMARNRATHSNLQGFENLEGLQQPCSVVRLFGCSVVLYLHFPLPTANCQLLRTKLTRLRLVGAVPYSIGQIRRTFAIRTY